MDGRGAAIQSAFNVTRQTLNKIDVRILPELSLMGRWGHGTHRLMLTIVSPDSPDSPDQIKQDFQRRIKLSRIFSASPQNKDF